MLRPKTLVLAFFRFFDRLIDGWRFRLAREVKPLEDIPIKIATYRGFGRPDFLFLEGRVLVKKTLRRRGALQFLPDWIPAHLWPDQRLWPSALLHISVGEQNFAISTDAKGYFTLSTALDPPLTLPDTDPWQKVDIALVGTPWTEILNLQSSTSILIPTAKAAFGIITDIDDTIIHTGVTSVLKWEMFYNTLFKPAEKRQPYAEVAAFFRALRKGGSGSDYNPIFYVSNSPRNIRELVESYLAVHQLPKGPLLLKDIGWPYTVHPDRDRTHKLENILRLLETYPHLNFVLIGDSGEKDPFIYHEVDKAHPGRIVGICIRDVNHRRRARRLERFFESNTNPRLQVFGSYRELAQWAHQHGWLQWERFLRLVGKN